MQKNKSEGEENDTKYFNNFFFHFIRLLLLIYSFNIVFDSSAQNKNRNEKESDSFK